MDRQKIMLTGIAVIVFAVFLASPALAHLKYRPYHKGLPRRVLVRHSHSPSESAKSAVPTQSKTKGFGLLDGAVDIVAGTLKILGNAVEAVLGSKAEPASQTQKIESPKDTPLRHKYSFSQKHKHPRSTPR